MSKVGGGQLQAKGYLPPRISEFSDRDAARDCRYMSVWTTQENAHPGSLHLQDLTWAQFCDLLCSERKLQTHKMQPDSFRRRTFCLRKRKKEWKIAEFVRLEQHMISVLQVTPGSITLRVYI